jgi:probable HAF family extracellular repeat protein
VRKNFVSVSVALTLASMSAVSAWGASGEIRNLGSLGLADPSWGYAVNDSGQAVGTSYTRGGNYHGFLYSGGVQSDLGAFGSRSNSNAYGINASGQIVGESGSTADFYPHAFICNGSGLIDLGTLGGVSSCAKGINAIGQITGQADIALSGSSYKYHAFLYSDTPGTGGAMVDLGTLGGTTSVAYSINASGQITGSSYANEVSVDHAFLYTGMPGHGGTMIDLLGGEAGCGYGINDFGQVVGNYHTSSGAYHAFLYTGTPGIDGHVIDLDAWLDAVNPVEGAKWTLGTPRCITNTGLICGFGGYDDGPGGLSDGTRAYVLDVSGLTAVPEPGSLAVVALGGLLVWRRRGGRNAEF